MDEIIRIIIFGIIGMILGWLLDKYLVENIIKYKQKQREKIYERHSIEHSYNKWINSLVIGTSFSLSIYFFDGANIILTSLLALIAILGMRIDQKIRIIPNELVLVVIAIGFTHQMINKGLRGVISGILALFLTAIIFFLSASITRMLSGKIGVGAGDIKLAMAISIYTGMEDIFTFLLGMVIFLIIYLIIGLYTRSIYMGSTFPMATQIMGGLMLTIYGAKILAIIEAMMLWI